jgi:hypothetical protein
MATKKYVVRDGFVVVQQTKLPDGKTGERRFESGETVSFDDAEAALHAHKLEFASQKDRDDALEAEKAAHVAKQAGMQPADLVEALVKALGQAMVASGAMAPPAKSSTSATA